MLLTSKIVSNLIEKNKPFAPEKAKVMLIHEDGRVIFAEKYEQGCKFWYADTMRESVLQGIIHKLSIFAKRNDHGEWVEFLSSRPPVAGSPMSRQDRILAQQEALKAARKGAKPAKPTPTVIDPVIKSSAVVEPLNPEPNQLVKPASDSEFISVRELEPAVRRRTPTELFVSFRSDGKIILCKSLRDRLTWPTLNMMVSRDFKRFAIMPGKEYNANQSGTYVSRSLCSKLKYPEDSNTVRAVLEWDEGMNMFVGEFQ